MVACAEKAVNHRVEKIRVSSRARCVSGGTTGILRCSKRPAAGAAGRQRRGRRPVANRRPLATPAGAARRAPWPLRRRCSTATATARRMPRRFDVTRSWFQTRATCGFTARAALAGASSSRERILGPPTRLGVGLGQPKGGDPGHLLVSAWHSSDFFRARPEGKVDAARAPPGRSGQGRPRSEPSGDDSSRAANNNTSDASLPKISFSPACLRTDRRAAFTTLQTRVRRAGTARRGPRRPGHQFLF